MSRDGAAGRFEAVAFDLLTALIDSWSLFARVTGSAEVGMSAERGGAYKIDPRAYRAALDALRLPPDRVLFVAGSAHDVPGASSVGMKIYWSNRQRLPVPPSSPAPLADEPDLRRLAEFV